MKKIFILCILTISLFSKEVPSLLIPLYSYPSKWNEYIDKFELIKNKKIDTYAIINPQNGPNNSIDPIYLKGINLLKKYNIKVIGYVHTQYGKRNPYKIKEDIYKWSEFYQDAGVSGIFFDETSTNIKYLNKYKDLIKYTKSLGLDFNILNAGYTTAQEYIDLNLANIVITYENSQEAWENSFPKQINKASENTKLSVLLHTMKNKNFHKALNKSKQRGFDYIYFTEDTMPNPWDDLSKYLLRVF